MPWVALYYCRPGFQGTSVWKEKKKKHTHSITVLFFPPYLFIYYIYFSRNEMIIHRTSACLAARLSSFLLPCRPTKKKN